MSAFRTGTYGRTWVFEIRTMFWKVHIESRAGGPTGWVLQILLIEQLKDAVWAVVLHLSKLAPKS